MEQKDSDLLKEWISGLTLGEYEKKIEMIVKRCFIKKSTFQNWRYGLCKIPALAKPIINEIAEKEIFKIETT